MIRKLLVATFLGAVLVLSGCASVPMAGKDADQQAKLFTPLPNLATVYIYRNENFGGAIKMPVLIDGVSVGDTGPKTYIRKTLPAGPHVITSKTENDPAINVDMHAGQTYFVWQEVKMGAFSARSALHLVDEQKGRAGVQQCKLLQSP